jgi:hypothetical protein
MDREPFFARLLGRTFRNSPGRERSVYFETEVEMQMARGVALHNKDRLGGFLAMALWFGRGAELSLSLVVAKADHNG